MGLFVYFQKGEVGGQCTPKRNDYTPLKERDTWPQQLIRLTKSSLGLCVLVDRQKSPLTYLHQQKFEALGRPDAVIADR